MTERTAEEWGRVAVSLLGWRWMPGMLTNVGRLCQKTRTPLSRGNVALYLPGGGSPGRGLWPCPDDPATAGCLLALLGPTPSEGYMAHVLPPSSTVTKWRVHMNTAHTGPLSAYGSTLGRACIAAAEALGRWPGGAA
jgi:hypothetical protein